MAEGMAAEHTSSTATPPGAGRTYLHVDMDAFFASVEENDRPELKGRPLAVGGGPGERGVVSSANYIARRYGLKAGMPSRQARRLCPELVFLPVRAPRYLYVSAQIMTLLRCFSPEVRPLSVDEASLDITGCGRLFGTPEQLGKLVKEAIRGRFELPSTVGIGPNRLVAKIAANLAKPDGLMVVGAGQAAAVLAPLPVSDMVGIGPVTARALKRIGITTLGMLVEAPDRMMRAMFGVNGPVLKQMAKGEWSGRMRQDDERGPVERSIGHQRTFAADIADPVELHARLVGLSEMVARRTRGAGMVGGVLTLTIRYRDFTTVHHQRRLAAPTDDEGTIIACAWRLLGEALQPGGEVRLLGLSLGDLAPSTLAGGQGELLYEAENSHRDRLYHAIDALRDRFGERVVARAMGQRWRRPGGGRGAAVIPIGSHRTTRGQSRWVSKLDPAPQDGG